MAIMANGTYLKEHADTVRTFLRVSQRAFRACLETPLPCTQVLADATSQRPEEVMQNWLRVKTLVDDDYGHQVALGAFNPVRVGADAHFIADAFKVDVVDANSAFSNDYLDKSIKLP